MKILHINTLCRGGAGKAAQRLHKALLSAQLESMLLTLERPKSHIPEHTSYLDHLDKWEETLKTWEIKGQKVLNKFAGTFKPHSFEPFREFGSSIDITTHPWYQQADIIHLHWVAGFLDGPTFFKSNKKPIAWTLHDMLPFTGGFHYEKGFPKEAYKLEIQEQVNQKAKAYASQKIHPVALSEWMKNKSKQSKLFGQYPHHLIRNSLDTKTFKPMEKKKCRSELGLMPDKKYLLFVSDHFENERKGFSYFLEAFQNIPDDWHLLGIGRKGNVDFKSNSITFLGEVSEELKLARIYNSADVFVLPSIEDNLPNTVAESLCCGTPVIAFNVGGLPEMITHQESGILVDEVSSDALKEAAVNFFAKMKSFNRDQISTEAASTYQPSKQAGLMKELYQKLVNEN